ncbi:MAG: hypothetical protein U5K43_00415, partial [Halofilum sp. (in: g-proteobacteria)]|nr:hypothetical protein [Halofilum sp. (in: g-proteobacteria)]
MSLLERAVPAALPAAATPPAARAWRCAPAAALTCPQRAQPRALRLRACRGPRPGLRAAALLRRLPVAAAAVRGHPRALRLRRPGRLAAVRRFQVHGDLAAGHLLGGLAQALAPALAPLDAVVPVPLPHARPPARARLQPGGGASRAPWPARWTRPSSPAASVRCSPTSTGDGAARRAAPRRRAATPSRSRPPAGAAIAGPVDDVVTTAGAVREAGLPARGGARASVVAV